METLKSCEANPVPGPVPLSRTERRLAWTTAVVAAALRLVWIVVLHPPTRHVYSDMAGYVERAQRLFTTPPTIADTLYPPGTSVLLGLLYRLDPAQNLAGLTQWLISLGVLALVWAIARRLYGNRVALAALGIAALYPPLTHYAALFLAENPFTLALLLTLWCGLRALAAERPPAVLSWALLCGVSLGLAAAFKNTVFAPFLLTAGFGLFWSLRRRRFSPALAIGLVLGASALLVPLAERCTRLSEGRFCPGANNIAMNVLMGHYGRNGPYHWHDAARGFDFEFTSPSASWRGYAGKVWLPFGAYDSAPNLAAARDWVRAHPAEALRLSVDSVGDLFFTPTLWPVLQIGTVDLGAWSQRAFWLLILLPALLHLASRTPAMLRLAPSALPEWLLLLPLLGLAATVFLSIGETRHRVPFDPLLIVLAAQGYVRFGARLGRGRSAPAAD